jgi:uncharacterized protein YcnI
MINHISRRRWRRPALALAGLAAAGLTLVPGPVADAHVRVAADHPTSGSFSALTFRVPNESDAAGTVEVAVQLPKDTPFLYVSTKPVPGWTATTKTETLPKPVDYHGTTITKAVRVVTWTADKGVQIGPGEYQEFSISAGPLPDPGTIELPATQTYSDGTVVAWEESTPASGDEPEHPAPAFEIEAAAAGDDHHDASAPAEQDTAEVASTTDPVARTLAGLGLGAGSAALVVALLARRRSVGSRTG